MVVGALSLSVGQPVWFDEGYSILLARESTGQLLALAAVDAHPPLYYLVLQAWAHLFGFSELALRSLSAVAAAGAVALMLVLVRRLFGVRVALVTLPMLVLAPFLLRYGYEIRMYALASLIGVAATYVMVRATQARTRAAWWWAGYAVLVALGMYTLYMMAAVWVAHVVWLVWTSLAARPRTAPWRWQWPWAYVGAVALFVPLMPTFFHQLANSVLPGIGKQLTLTGLVDIATMTGLYQQEWAIGGWLSLLLGATLVLLVSLAAWLGRTVRGETRRYLWLLYIMAGVPVLFFALTSLPPREPIYIIRYVAHVAVYFYALAGVLVGLHWTTARRRQWLAPVACVVTLSVLLLGVASLARMGNLNFERMQDPRTSELRASVQCDPETVVVADDPYTYIDSVYYWGDCDLRFYAPDEIGFVGGYAPLHGSEARLADTGELRARRVIHLHWTGDQTSLVLPGRYRLSQTETLDKQVVDRYELSAE